ncbi:hypothetical protein CEUSTIGMA_g9406.t1 [Chlamydomonas eustigma]|uniref:WDR11 TPR domain-containing protein n=1 Tax=Chlamydomonas eustigma TaxID=1157962 RepID=A0A250XFW7_9CHLO|nr:hypothetical protein CEUSTIGMA_g9406.t1 [Chlamydomonas eustigma]|eukprot:GAX81978.1 hypothetical protein CEUSTIGMA_g9406.t1 [Chlamydomonas eustigma]
MHTSKPIPTGRDIKLWDSALALAEAQERTVWHEAIGGSPAMTKAEEQSQGSRLEEKRLLEYVVLGDFQTAVAFLLASSPDQGARYYRDALITMALASAANSRDQSHQYVGVPLQVQVPSMYL